MSSSGLQSLATSSTEKSANVLATEQASETTAATRLAARIGFAANRCWLTTNHDGFATYRCGLAAGRGIEDDFAADACPFERHRSRYGGFRSGFRSGRFGGSCGVRGWFGGRNIRGRGSGVGRRVLDDRRGSFFNRNGRGVLSGRVGGQGEGRQGS